MAFEMKKPSRRQFLIATGLVGGGLMIGYAMSGPSRRERAGRARKSGGSEVGGEAPGL